MHEFCKAVICCGDSVSFDLLVCVFVFFFFVLYLFFQAEDGIRDLVRSRGLGDVYKRQTWIRDAAFTVHALLKLGFTNEAGRFMGWLDARYPVSYTHLTLPTSDLV